MSEKYEKPEIIKIIEVGSGVLLESDGYGHDESDYSPWVNNEPEN